MLDTDRKPYAVWYRVHCTSANIQYRTTALQTSSAHLLYPKMHLRLDTWAANPRPKRSASPQHRSPLNKQHGSRNGNTLVTWSKVGYQTVTNWLRFGDSWFVWGFPICMFYRASAAKTPPFPLPRPFSPPPPSLATPGLCSPLDSPPLLPFPHLVCLPAPCPALPCGCPWGSWPAFIATGSWAARAQSGDAHAPLSLTLWSWPDNWQPTSDVWHLAWQKTDDIWHKTHDMLHMSCTTIWSHADAIAFVTTWRNGVVLLYTPCFTTAHRHSLYSISQHAGSPL